MFITCSSNISGNTCAGYGDGSVSGETPTFGTSIYPIVNSKLITNSIEPVNEQGTKEVHTYTLYLQFKDDGTDQSDDMGKVLQGKVQIYDPKDVIAIRGTVDLTNAVSNATYYVEFGEENKTSQILSDGSYIIYGITTGTNELNVKYKLGENTTTVLTKSINVTKGTTATVASDGSSITMTDLTEKVEIDIDLVNLKLTGGNIIESNGNAVLENEEIVTNYTQNDVDTSEQHIVAIGANNSLNVVAAFNEDFTSATITKNTAESDGLMKDVEGPPLFYEHPGYEVVTDIVIKNGVKHIGAMSIFNLKNLKNITIPKSVTSIGSSAIAFNSVLENIYYEGTMEDWNAITKDADWLGFGASDAVYTLHCSDGEIQLSRES